MLQSRSLVAALSAAGAPPQLVAGCFCALSNYKRHQPHGRVVQALFAMDTGSAGYAEAPQALDVGPGGCCLARGRPRY